MRARIMATLLAVSLVIGFGVIDYIILGLKWQALMVA